MGFRGSKMAIFRPSCYGDLERYFRVFEASLLWGNTEDRTAGKRRERDRVLPDFPKTRAHALRFGSMNPISSHFRGVVVEAMGAGGRES